MLKSITAREIFRIHPEIKIYNWFTVKTDKLCPKGFHVPSIDEWTTLKKFLGEGNQMVEKLKELGFISSLSGWNGKTFTSMETEAIFWSNSETEDKAVYTFRMSYGESRSCGFVPEGFGFSVRCLKDN